MKTHKIHKLFILSALIILIGAFLLSKNLQVSESKTKGLLIPHHLLAKLNIEKIYSENANDAVDTVILISPNHFYYGYNDIQTTNQNFEYENQTLEIDQDLLKKITKNSSTKIENKNYKKEHGITVHVPFILKSFPNAKVLPIILKRETSENELNELIENLNQATKNKNIIIIASIDFSHYVDEKIAAKTDEKIINLLRDLSKNKTPSSLAKITTLAKTDTGKNKEAVAMDSPESLYIFLKLLENKNTQNFTLFARTSTKTLTGIKKPDSNTSHIFGVFE